MNDEHLTMIEDCEVRAPRLSERDREKVASLREWLEADKSLTVKQAEMLNEIWEMATARG